MGATLDVADDVGEVDHGVGDIMVGMKASEVAEGCGGGWVGVEGVFDTAAEGAGFFEIGGHGVERRQQVGEVEVEGGAPGEKALEGEVGGADRAAEVQAAGVRFGVEFELDGNECAAHGGTGDDGLDVAILFCTFAEDGLDVAGEEVLAELLCVGVRLGQGPAGRAVGGLDDGEAAFEDGGGLVAEG